MKTDGKVVFTSRHKHHALVLKVILLSLAIGAVVAVTAASADRTVWREVSGHRFKVPSEYLYDQQIAWLPAPESDSFVFVLDPNYERDRIPEHRILVERLSRLCPTDATTEATQMLRIVCGQERSAVEDRPPYFHIQSATDTWSSELFSVGKGGARRPVAYCQRFDPNPAKPIATTLCTTFWAHQGLKLQFSFDLNEASALPAMREKAMMLLTDWEVR